MTPHDFLEAWTEVAKKTGMKGARALTGPREKQIKILLKTEEDIDIWREVFLQLSTERNGFYRGVNRDGWKAGIDYVLRAIHRGKMLDMCGDIRDRNEAEQNSSGDDWRHQARLAAERQKRAREERGELG